MFKTIQGNILDAAKGIIVHGCNATDGPVGGLAAAVFEKYPQSQLMHNDHVNTAWIPPLGTISVYKVSDELIIVNAITQRLPGAGTLSYDAVLECFKHVDSLANHIEEATQIQLPILYPKIGAGIAGGNWNIISTIIQETIGHRECVLYTI